MKERRAKSEPEATVNQDPFPYLDSLPFPTPDLYKNITEVVKVVRLRLGPSFRLNPKAKIWISFILSALMFQKRSWTFV